MSSRNPIMFWGNKSVSFNPEKDIPPLTDKVILVTGGNVGLGKQAVLQYARHHPRLIWLAGRNVAKANAAADDIKKIVPDAAIQVLELDLASFASIKRAAATVLSTSPRLDILMLNAGIMAVPPGVTTDGYEVQFGTNHMGHALLTKLLLPLLQTTASSTTIPPADVRIVSLSSHGHVYSAKGGIAFPTLKGPAADLGTVRCYGQSKLANRLWASQLAKRYPQFTVASVHPGVVHTQLLEKSTGAPGFVRAFAGVGKWLLTSVEQGVKNQLWASVGSGVKSGEYYEPVGLTGLGSAEGANEELAEKLWEWTEKELEGHVAA